MFTMKVPNRTHYALKILVDLAMVATKKPCTVAEIAGRQAIPKQYLHQILLVLKSSGMVRSRRGLHGGYMLAALPSEMSVARVVRSMQGALLSPPQGVLGRKDGVDAAACEVWHTVCSRVEKELEALSIQDLCRRAAEKTEAADYVI